MQAHPLPIFVKNLIPHFIQEQYHQGKSKGQLQAFTMFIDLSGFTPLTEALMNRGHRGAEELSIILNDIFAPLVNLVYAKGGFIPYLPEMLLPPFFLPDKRRSRQLNFYKLHSRYAAFSVAANFSLPVLPLV